jgi:hypothetical protein
MPMFEGAPDMRAAPGHIFFLPVDSYMTLQNGMLQLQPRTTVYCAIDVFPLAEIPTHTRLVFYCRDPATMVLRGRRDRPVGWNYHCPESGGGRIPENSRCRNRYRHCQFYACSAEIAAFLIELVKSR